MGFFIQIHFYRKEETAMIKGLAITPPILGRISIGKVVEKNGKRLPERDDQFTITSQIQGKDGWIKHPLDEQLRDKAPNQNQKLRTIPVRMIFNDPELNLRAEYILFDRQTGRPVCVGNGETCQRLTNQGVEQHPCPSPDLCSLAQGGNCKPFGRLHVNLDESDELGTFIFRTTGFNSIRTLAARLSYYHAASNGLLSCLPLQLTLRGKSTTQSYRTPVYYVDLTLRDGTNLQQAIQMAQEIDQQSKRTGFNQSALDQMARKCLNNVQFEANAEEGLDLVEEFYADEGDESEKTESKLKPRVKSKPNQRNFFMQDIQEELQKSLKVVN